ncbi:MAG: DUF898 domain-containing protein [Pseudomonadota bacterium]|nr:MAG: DUF898 domain-containing protein [Pseudomonadota bacterium]
MDTRLGSAVSIKSLQFTGKAGEYFKIWIVNILLTIVTLGIYSAWAKVRTNRYFYGNTILDNAGFEYLANPVSILKGRLIATAFFIIYAVVGQFMPLAQIGFSLVLLLLLPWLVVQAMVFRTRNTSYRNIRFGFQRRFGQAAMVFIVLPILAGITLGLAYPYFQRRRHQFMMESASYGNTRFEFAASTGSFYTIYLAAVGVTLVSLVVVALVAAIAAGIAVALLGGEAALQQGANEQFGAIGAVMPMIFMPLIYLALFAFVKAKTTNLVWNELTLGPHGFTSELKFMKLFWLYISNTFAIILSLGLLVPWAKVRMARYRVEHIRVCVAGDLDGFIAAEQANVTSTAEGVSDVFDIDIGL